LKLESHAHGLTLTREEVRRAANTDKLPNCPSVPDSTLASYPLLLFIDPASPEEDPRLRRARTPIKSMEEGNGR